MDKIKAKLTALWNGDVPLVQTFWLYHFAVSLVLGVLANAVLPLLAFVSVLWAAFMVLPIWRSSDKYSGNSLFALLAKIAAVLIGLGALSNLL